MKIVISKSAKKALEQLDAPTKQRIKKGIYKLPDGDVKKLQGYTNAYRLRIGDYRILYDFSDKIEITNILPRGSAYKK